MKEFEANFDGRDQKFLQFLTLERNKDMYQIIKTKSHELITSQVDHLKNQALLAMKLVFASIREKNQLE